MDNLLEFYNQRFELLTIYNNFQEDIKEFRNNFEISLFNFKKNDNFKKNKLIELENDLILRYSKSKKFKERRIDYRHLKFYIEQKISSGELVVNNDIETPYGKYTDQVKSNLEKYSGKPTPYKDYFGAINSLLKKYNLSERYKEVLRFYIFTNKIFSISSVIVRRGDEDGDLFTQHGNEKSLLLSIFPDTSKIDISLIWPEIEKWQKAFLKTNAIDRHRKSENYEFIKRCWELQNNISLKEAEKQTVINNEFIVSTKKTAKGVVNRYEKNTYNRDKPGELFSKMLIGIIGNSEIRQYALRAKKRIFESD